MIRLALEKKKVIWKSESLCGLLTFISASACAALPWQLDWVLPAWARFVVPHYQTHVWTLLSSWYVVNARGLRGKKKNAILNMCMGEGMN